MTDRRLSAKMAGRPFILGGKAHFDICKMLCYNKMNFDNWGSLL